MRTTICPIDDHVICDYLDPSHMQENVIKYPCAGCHRNNSEDQDLKRQITAIKSAAGCLFFLTIILIGIFILVKLLIELTS